MGKSILDEMKEGFDEAYNSSETGMACPHCGSSKTYKVAGQYYWHCLGCAKDFGK